MQKVWVIETTVSGETSVGLLFWLTEQAAWDHVAAHEMRKHFDHVTVRPLTLSD